MAVLFPHTVILPVTDYDLDATLGCGQAFRWQPTAPGSWEGVIHGHWVRLSRTPQGLAAETVSPAPPRPGQDGTGWTWLTEYLQTGVVLEKVLATFPPDIPLQEAIRACRGLRLLRQDPWECLASFVCSSTKQIVQIRQIVKNLCRTYGDPVPTPPGHAPAFAFPRPETLAACEETALRRCKMGFRAPYLRACAHAVAEGRLPLATVGALPLDEARQALMELPGVGRKVADCVLLFGLGFPAAFPVDVWVNKALRQLYFPRRRRTPKQIEHFARTHFGPHAGYAQQYLFHYMRTQAATTQAK